MIAAIDNASEIHLMISSRFVLDFIFFVIENLFQSSNEGKPAYGDWNVRVKKVDNGCIINVNITNMNYPTVVYVSGKKIEQVVALSSGKQLEYFRI